ncbi:hypothetical protein L1987_48926 [Smallanthus sonchifolius]|uniref:Uncharacterized protein n=1 Tax=Smallanthus sonchifolius TaxID=185202 RepID=A0ACB9FTX0_9ASTR|nr:hypothetical protein L1987_48926 [Smallanthus sonchifolius]
MPHAPLTQHRRAAPSAASAPPASSASTLNASAPPVSSSTNLHLPKTPSFATNATHPPTVPASPPAAEISSTSITKAEVAAVTEADWRAKEASEWRKKAKEAVNHVVKLMEIEKKKRDGNHKAVIDDVNGNAGDGCRD